MKINYTTKREKIKWIISRHKITNHMYDKHSYEFHLGQVLDYAIRFGELEKGLSSDTLTLAALGHDLIEDTRTSYNDVKEFLGEDVAEIVYALTNEKGRTRKDRANKKYYDGIRACKGAVFIKLCDRLANVEYTIHSGNKKMLNVYHKENSEFLTELGINSNYSYLKPMAHLLEKMLEKK